MPNFADVQTRVLLNLGNHAKITSATADDFVEASNDVILELFDWSKRYADLIFNTVADYTTGNVDVTVDNDTVNGGTSAPTWTSAMAGRFFRLSSEDAFYQIKRVASATQLILERAYAGATATNQSYTIFQHLYPVFPVQTAEYSTGTADVTTNNATVSGNSTVWTASHVGLFFRSLGSATTGYGEPLFYKVTARASNTSITIDPPYRGRTATTQYYGLYARSSDVEKVINIYRDRRLTQVPRWQVHEWDPNLTTIGTPENWWMAERDQCNMPRVGLWPVPSDNHSYRAHYKRASKINMDTVADKYSEPFYKSELLEFMATARGARYLFAITGDEAWKMTAMDFERDFKALLDEERYNDVDKTSTPDSVVMTGDPVYSSDYLVDHDPA